MLNFHYLVGFPGGMEWPIILLVLLLLFGGRKLPELARGFAKSIREFRGALDEANDEIKKSEKSEK